MRAVRTAVGDLLRIPATIQLIGQVPGARVYVDDVFMGTTPLEPFVVVGAGEVEVRVEHWDYPAFATKTTLTPGRVTRVSLDLLSYKDMDARRAARLTSSALGGALAIAGIGGGALIATRGWQLYDTYEKQDPRTSQAVLDAQAADINTHVVGGYALAGTGAVIGAVSLGLLLWDPDAERMTPAP